MGIGKGGSPTTTSNSQNQNVATVPNGLANFQDIYNRANTASQAPYQPYTGELVNQATWQQNQGRDTVNANAGPITQQQIQNYFNPYQSNVINALTGNINETNAQQLQQVRGNAAAQHALGGDREAVAEAELARQQNLGNAPAIANALAGGYNTALQTAQQQQQAGLQGGEAQFNVGTAYQQTGQAADTAAYQQYLQRLAYPYQQAQFLANIGIPASGAMGGQQFQTGLANQILTPPGISLGQGIAGLGLLGAGLGFGSVNGSAARGGRIEHRYPGGRTVDPDNPYAVEPWNVKAVDVTGGSPGTPLQTPQNQVHPVPGISITQGGQQSNPLGNISQDITAAKGLYGLGKSAAGLFGGLGAGSGVADALAAGTDAGVAIGGLGEGAAAGAAGAAAVDTAADFSVADLLPLMFAKRGGAIYPKKYAMGGSPYDAAVNDISGREQQGGQMLQAMLSRSREMNPYLNTATLQQPAQAYPRGFASGGDADSDDDQPWALESRWPTQGTDTAIPSWKSADPRGDAAALKNYGLTQAPEVSPNTGSAVPLPQSRPAPAATTDDDNDDELPAKSAPDSLSGAPTPVKVQKDTRFDPATASYQDIMDRNNFKDNLPQKQSLMSLIRDPKTRGDALMEMGLRILAAPPTSKSGLSEIASGALGTVADYNKFSSDKLSAQEKAQELAAKLKQQSNTDDYNDERLRLQREQLKALTDYRNSTLNQRFQKLARGNIVMGNYQYPGPTGAVVAAYADKTDGHIYDAHTHEELSGGRWAGTNAVDLGINKPPGAGGGDPISAARAAIKAGAAPDAVKQRLRENGIEPPADL